MMTDAQVVNDPAMKTMAYAVVSGSESRPRQPIHSASMGNVEFRPFGEYQLAYVKVHPSDVLQSPTSRDAQDFMKVILELNRFADVVPFRFGTLLDERQISQESLRLSDALRRVFPFVAGCCEICAYWALPDESPRTAYVKFKCTESLFESSADQKSSGSVGGEYLRKKGRSSFRVQQGIDAVQALGKRIADEFGANVKHYAANSRTVPVSYAEGARCEKKTLVLLSVLLSRSMAGRLRDALQMSMLNQCPPVVITEPAPAYTYLGDFMLCNEIVQVVDPCNPVQTIAA